MAAMTWPQASGGANEPGKAIRSESIATRQGGGKTKGEAKSACSGDRSDPVRMPIRMRTRAFRLQRELRRILMATVTAA